MAKFARVGYGSAGQGVGESGQGYTYIVNDNVRTGDIIQPSVKHWKSKTIYATTGKILGTNKENTAKGKEAKANAEKNGAEVVNAYTGKELGAVRETGDKGRYVAGRADPITGETISSYNEQARGGNILARQKETGGKIADTYNASYAVESFESYSKKFMKGEK